MLELTQEQDILRETIREFAQTEIAPLASQIDRECAIPQALLSKLLPLGLFGISIPAEFGGAGADFLSLVIACEEISKASGSLGLQLAFHNAVVCESLTATLNGTAKQELLPMLTSGTLGAFDFSSQEKGGVTCTIRENKLVANGSSKYVANASSAGVFVICAKLAERTGEHVLFAFSKEQVSPASLLIGEPIKLMGMRASGFATVSFENLELSLESLICEIPKTQDYLSQLLTRSRLAVASSALGLAQASIDSEVKYANERTQFDTKIGNFYAVQDMIARDVVDVETARSLCYLTARDIKAGKTIERDAAVSKIASSDASVRAARHAIRVHGGYGFTKAYPVERYARDARIAQIYPESNEDLKSFVAESILLGRV